MPVNLYQITDTESPGRQDLVSVLRKQLVELDQDFESWRPKYHDIVRYMAPANGWALDYDISVNDGTRKDSYIINNVAGRSLRVLTSGLHGSLTSPAKPWFELQPVSKLADVSYNARAWLRTVRDILLRVLAESNFYSSIHMFYKELALFGTAVMFLEEDDEDVIRCRTLTVGEYRLSLDHKQRPTTLFRRVPMTASQIVDKFGEAAAPPAVLRAYKGNRLTERFSVIHVVRPRSVFDPNKSDKENMPIESVYFMEYGRKEEAILRVSGFRSYPFVVGRWDRVAGNTYGIGVGDEVLGDVKQLQRIETDKLKAIARQADPAVVAPAAFKQAGVDTRPGGQNFTDSPVGVSPLYTVQMRLDEVRGEISSVSERIQQTCYVDLFAAILTQNKTMTATEVAERHEEKLTLLGPVVERHEEDVLDPSINRIFSICWDAGIIPHPPEELEFEEIRPVYTSVLARAQELVSLGSIERFLQFVAMAMQVDATALDRVDVDKLVDEYAKAMNVAPESIREDMEVDEMKDEREQAAQMQQMIEAAPAAKAGMEAEKIAREME
jgi:hypothetical protein